MTVIKLSAGRKHTIKIGGEVQEVTLRPGEVRYLPFTREAKGMPKVEPAKLPEKPTGLPYTPRKAVPEALPYTPRKAVPEALPYTPRKAVPEALPYTPRKAVPEALPYTPRVAPPTKVTYKSWSEKRPKPTFDDIVAMIEGVRGRRDLGFKPTFDNLVSLLKKFKK